MVELVVQRGGYSRTINKSAELVRIAALPRYNVSALTLSARHIVSSYIKPRGTMQLRPLQEEALTAAFHAGGLAGLMSVGSGKTLVASLIPSLFPDSRALILAKAGLVSQGERMMAEYSQHFELSSSVKWMSYDFLSRANGTHILSHLKPDIIIADEAQCLANPKSARTKRFLRYMEEHLETMFFFLSGTITRHSIRDFSHLMSLALGESSPLPRTWPTITEWAECLDNGEGVRYPGALSMLDDTLSSTSSVEDARKVVQARIKDTLGVVASVQGSVDSTITIKPLDLKPSDAIEFAIRELRMTWCRPDGEELILAIDLWRLETQLLMGGYYRWVEQPPKAWLEARKNWNRGLREFLNKQSDAGIDSPLLVTNALIRGDVELIGRNYFDPLKSLYTKWKQEEANFPMPNVAWEWVDKRHITSICEKVRVLSPCIIWSAYRAPSMYLARQLDVPYYGSSEGDSINHEDGTRSIVASIRAHKEGRNLQAFNRNVVIGSISSGADWEQLLGRTHRAGQKAEDVEIYVPVYLKEDLEKGIEGAQYIEQVTGAQQKLNYADKENWPW